VFVPVFTDVLDKTGEAAIALVEAAFTHLRGMPWFLALWAIVKTVYIFPDVGRHFKCQVMLHYLLIQSSTHRALCCSSCQADMARPGWRMA